MSQQQNFQIDYRQFSSRFKIIRKQKDNHLGDYLLMKDNKTKRRVIVKNQAFNTQQQLECILEGVKSLLSLNQSPVFVKFIGFSLMNSNKIIQLIYEYHDNTLQQSLKSNMLHNKLPSDKSMMTFLLNMIEALHNLEILKINHLDIKPSMILEQNKESLHMCYKLFYTNYTVDSISQIKNLDINIQNYFLSNIQLQQLSEQNIQELEFQDKIKSDMQSLGLVGLFFGTLTIKDRLYIYNEEDHIEVNQQLLNKRLKQFKKTFSKKTVRLLQSLLYPQTNSFQQILMQFNEGAQIKPKIRSSRVSEEDKTDKIKKPFLKNNLPEPKEKVIQRQKQRIPYFPKFEEPKRNNQNLANSRERKYLSNLEEIQKKIIYKPFSNELLPSMQEKRYSDNSKYIGQLYNNQREGKGIYYYAQGDVYAGQWQENTLQGYGIYLFSNGQKYEGQVLKGVKSGKGQYIYANNNRYVGEWLNDKKHGHGTYYYSEKGESYQGQFKDGVKEGIGRYTYSNGDFYQGNFHRGEKSGLGVAQYQDGTVVEGEWENGQLVGNAKIKYPNGDFSKIIFSKGIKNGDGTYKQLNGTTFEGKYINNQKSGFCEINYFNGDKYRGNLLKGKKQGLGLYTYNNGVEYQGEWVNDKKHGQGKLLLANGIQLHGLWNNNILSNRCKIIYENQDIYQGQTNGLLVKQGQGKYIFSSGQILEGKFLKNEFLNGTITDKKGNIRKIQ